MSSDTEHLAPENSGARCQHLAPGTSPKPGKNLMKERYLSKTLNVTFVYLSKCNIKLAGFFWKFQKNVFVNRSTGMFVAVFERYFLLMVNFHF